MPTDYRSMFEKDYIGAWDLTDGDKTFTIKKVQRGELTSAGGRKTKKPVVYFTEIDKGFALNATNGKTIAALYGNMIEDWTGKRITVYKSRTTMGSEEVDCVRVRPKAPKGALAVDEAEPLITEEQAMELETLCKTGGRDLTDEFLKVAEVETFTPILARAFKGAKKWINDQRLKEHESTQP